MASNVTTMQQAAATQGRVIIALMLRELRTRFGRTQMGYLWAVLEPVTYIATMTFIFDLFGRPPRIGDSWPVFFATGVLTFLTYRKLSSSLANAFTANQSLLVYPIVKPIDTLAARALLEFATKLVVILIVFAGIIVLLNAPLPTRPEHMIVALVLMAVLGFGIGTISAVITRKMPSWPHIDSIIQRPLIFISGVMFVPDSLPNNIREWLEWNPILHGIEWMRYGYYDTYRADTIDIMYLAWWAFGATLVGLAAERIVASTAAE